MNKKYFTEQVARAFAEDAGFNPDAVVEKGMTSWECFVDEAEVAYRAVIKICKDVNIYDMSLFLQGE